MHQSDGPFSNQSGRPPEQPRQGDHTDDTNRSSKTQSQNDSGVIGSIRSRKEAHDLQEVADIISESSDTSQELSRQSIQSSDDENFEDTRIQEKSTDERTIKNQLEFTKGFPKSLISIFNDKSDKNISGREKHVLWATPAEQSAASISNEVKIRKYMDSDVVSKLSLAADIIFNFDTMIGVLYLVLKVLLYRTTGTFDSIVIPLSIIVFSVVFRLILKLLGDERRHTLQCQFNYNFQKKFFKAKKFVAEKGDKTLRNAMGGSFAFDLWENLKIGDIIIIKQHQEFPADVLLLDSEYRSTSDRRNTTVDELARATIQTLKEKIIVQSGSNTRNKIRCKQSFPGTMMKNRVVETQKVSPLQVVSSFSGNLQWEYNLQGFFCGSFKFADGTGDYDIDTDNIVKRGSFLRSNHKLVCLVINIGDSCMSSLPKVSEELRKNFFLASIKNWFWTPFRHEYKTHMRYTRFISVAMILIFAILEGVQFTMPSLIGFEETILSAANKKSSQGEMSNSQEILQFLNWAIVVSIQCTPLFFEVIFKALTYGQAYFAEWDLNLVPANLRFNNLNAMAKLPWISHIVTSPGTLEENQIYKVTYFRFGDQRFYNTDNPTTEQSKSDQNTQDASTQNLVKTDKEKNNNKDHDDSQCSFSTSDDAQFNFEYLPQQRNHSSYEFCNQKADMLRRSKTDPDYELFSDFISLIAVCHQATHKTKDTILEQGPRQSHFRSFIEEEEAQLMFAKQFGCTFTYRKSQVLTIQNEDRVERFEELAYIYVKLKEGCSKVNLQVLRPFNKSGILIINLKGPCNGCTDSISTSKGTSRQILRAEAWRLESLGFNLQLFCQRELTKGETASFQQKFDSLNMYSKTFKYDLQALCSETCTEMKILGMLGFQKVVPLRNSLTVQDCIQNGVKVWLLSQFSKRKTIVNCNNLNLMMNNEQIEVFGRSEREIEESLRLCFNKVFETANKGLLAQGARADADEEDRDQVQKENAVDHLRDKDINKNVGIWGSFKALLDKLISRGTGRLLSKKNFVENRKRRVLLVGDKTLLIIVRDENLMRVFISLALYCDLIIGSGVNPALKGRLASEIVNFAKVGRDQNAGYVMSIVGSPEDRNLSQKAAADVCCFVMNRHNSKDIEINSDMTISHFYAITYLLFKHGSQLHRRVIVASRFHVRKSLFLCMLFLAQYFQDGFAVVSQFKNYFLGIYLTFGFEMLVLVTAALYESEAFQFLHRVNGQYKCNPTIRVINVNMIISQVVEIIFDITVILYFSNLGGNLSSILLPNGFTISSEGLNTLQDILLILYTIPLFLKLPLVNYTSLTLLSISILVFLFFQIMNQDFEEMKIYFNTPQTMFQLAFIILMFALKFEVKRIMRRINPFQSRWDYFNTYIDERLELEQYESWEQLKDIDMENSYNADRLIDVQFVQDRRNMQQISQNLLRLPKRTDLTDLIFEQMSQINKRKTGQSNSMKLAAEKNQKGIGINNQKLYKESLATVDPLNLSFKQVHQEQDFIKYNLTLFANDRMHLNDFIQQISWLILLFVGLLVQIILRMFLSQTYKKINGTGASQYVFYIFNIVLCTIAVILLRLNLVTRKDYVLIAVSFLVMIFTIAQIELTARSTFDIEHNITIAALISFAFINRTIHSLYVFIFAWMTCIWCFSLNLRLLKLNGPVHSMIIATNDSISSTSKNFALNLITHHYLLGIPVFTLVWSIYAYVDEFHRKTTFLVLNRRIKEFKFLKQLIQRLVPESIRKYNDVHSNNSAVDLLKNVTIIVVKIKNYGSLVSDANDQMQVYKTLQMIQKSLQKIATRHGVFLVNSNGEQFVFVAGVKAFEKNISQKVLSFHHTHRACKFAIVLIQSTKEISRSTGINILFHVGINSPTHIACGIIGDIRPAFTMIGTGVIKAEAICDRAQAMQICLSKETYDMMGLFGVSLNIKVNGAASFFQNPVKEIVYELQAKHKYKIAMRPVAKYSLPLGQMKLTAFQDNESKNFQQDGNQEEQQIETRALDALSSDHGSKFSSLQQTDSDISGQFQSVMTFNSETRMDNSDATYVQTDYQFQMGAEFKDDQEIASNPVTNSTYKLVQRNKWLLSFSNALELKYLWQSYFELQQQNIVFNWLLLLCIFLGIAIVFTNLIKNQGTLWLQLVWIVIFGMISYILQTRITKISESKVYFLEYWQTGLALLFVAIFVINSFVNPSFLSYNAFTQLALISLVVFQGQRGWRFMTYLVLVILVCGTLIGNQIYFARLQVDPFPKIGEVICSVVLAGIFLHHCNSREVIQRINYNLNMLLSVEDVKNEEQIQRLLPAQSILSIKKDEEFLQHLVDSTILICTIHGFTEFLCQATVEQKPHIGHQFIKAVYHKFDLLVEHNNQYKLQANQGDYVLLSNPSYTTDQNTELERTSQAYKVIQIGQAMIQAVQDTKKQWIELMAVQKELVDFSNIGVQIGITTGQLLGYISGTTFLQYEVFGEALVHGMRMQKVAPKDTLCMSETTKKLLDRQTYISVSLDSSFYQDVEVAESTKLKTYLVNVQEKTRTNESQEHTVELAEDQSVSGSQTHEYSNKISDYQSGSGVSQSIDTGR